MMARNLTHYFYYTTSSCSRAAAAFTERRAPGTSPKTKSLHQRRMCCPYLSAPIIPHHIGAHPPIMQ